MSPTSSGRSNKTDSASTRSNSRAARRSEGATSKVFDFMRQELARDADHVSESDIRKLKSTVPEKLEAMDTRQLRKELAWVGEMVERVRTLWDMLFDREFSIDWKTRALIAASLLYFVLPIDLTPDFIPGIGYIDDALVLATLWRLIQEKIDEYIEFVGGATPKRLRRPKRA